MAVNNNLGVGSGLPLEATLSKLREAENVSLSLVKSRYDQTNQRLSAYGMLKGALEAFQQTAKMLDKPASLSSMKANSSLEGLMVNASEKAIPGSYQVEVEALARAQTLASAGLADRHAAIGSGGVISFTLQDGTSKTLDLSEKGTSLEGIVQAINADESLGLSATIVNDGSASPHRLLLTTKATGTQAAIRQVSVTGNEDLHQIIGFGLTDPADPTASINHLQVQQAAQNAKLSINGIVVESAGNEIKNAIEGISLTVSKLGTGTVTIAADTEAASKAITAFVTAYNSLQSTLNKLTAYNSDTQQSSALTGDTLARRVQSQMRTSLNAVTDGKLGSLSRMGISTNPSTGELKVDNGKLSDALKNHLADVIALFSSETGIAARVAKTSEDFLRSDGMFATSDTSIKQTLKHLENEYEATERRIDAKIAAYRTQFLALDRSVSQMSGLSAYLTTQLSRLGNSGSNGG